jgi:hypothetical protein
MEKLTRVLSKDNMFEIQVCQNCDGAILKTLFNGDLQTTRYSTIDQYATTYKGISLRGFEKRNASLPDGTEAKQNQILNLVKRNSFI